MGKTNKQFQYPTPLSVSFHCWEDQSCPLLEYTTYLSVLFDKKQQIPKSYVWSNSNITSTLFAGTASGTIVAYQIQSNDNKIIQVLPICLIFGHNEKITSLVNYLSLIHNSCIVSLSIDGSISVISVEDFSIIKNVQKLFSRSSMFLCANDSNKSILIASQSYGTIEVADIKEETILYRISQFPSIITGLYKIGLLNCVSFANGCTSIFSVFKNTVVCNYCFDSVKNDLNIFESVLSPNLDYILYLSPNKWYLMASENAFFEKEMDIIGDSFVKGNWISETSFYISYLGGRVEVWNIESNKNHIIFESITTKDEIFKVSFQNNKDFIHPQTIKKGIELRKTFTPQMKFAVDHSTSGTYRPICVTKDGFIVSSPGKSSLIFSSETNEVICNLANYFNPKYRCRCACGNPIIHEARIGCNDKIYIDDFKKPIGEHEGANLLFSPPSGKKFFSFSKNGSVKAWSNKLLASFYDLTEPVLKTKWIQENHYIIVLGEHFSFSVIDEKSLTSLMLCTGHNSQIIYVLFYDGLFHAKTISTTYSWNMNSELVSKRKSKEIHKVQKCSLELLRNIKSMPCLNRTNFDLNDMDFYSIVPIIMPNCQTFAIVLNVIDFLDNYLDYNNLQVRDNKDFLPLKMLWRCHLGEGNLDEYFENDMFKSFDFAISGDNYTVTLPVTLKNTSYSSLRRTQSLKLTVPPLKFKKNIKAQHFLIDNSLKEKTSITTDVAFSFSPFISAIHSVAAFATSNCFANVSNDEYLPIISSISQSVTYKKLLNSVNPSIFALANWLESSNENLRIVIYRIIQFMFNNLMEKDALEIIKKVFNLFHEWCVILPIIFIYCKNHKPPHEIGKKCCNHLFPFLFDYIDTLDIFLDCFPNIYMYIDNINDFFVKLIEGNSKKLISERKIIGFGLVSPVEFFDFIISNPHYLEYIKLLFEKWPYNENELLSSLISHILSAKKKGITIDFQTIFNMVNETFPFVGYYKKYIVIGCENGEVVVHSIKTALILWKIRISLNPISFISVSPNGSRFIILNISDGILTWVRSTKDKKNSFELVSSMKIDFRIIPTTSFWKNENTIILYNKTAKLFETSMPKL